MGKVKLFLDIDDVIFNTESYISSILRKQGITTSCSYEYLSDNNMGMLNELLSDYSKIPTITGSIDGVKMLKTEYDVCLLSYVTFPSEYLEKLKIAKLLGVELYACHGDDYLKSSVSTEGSIRVDDKSDILNANKSFRNICFYKKCFFNGFTGEVVFDWYELLDRLL